MTSSLPFLLGDHEGIMIPYCFVSEVIIYLPLVSSAASTRIVSFPHRNYYTCFVPEMAIVEDDGEWVLREVPTQPPDFLDIWRLRNESQGFYIVGHDKFYAANFSISSIFQRELGSADEFVLGILSVFLIATLSELVQTMLLRTGRDRRLHAKYLLYAMMVDEMSHFHSVLRYLRGGTRRAKTTAAFIGRRKSIIISIVVLSIMLLIFVCDVIAVIVTQQTEIHSSENEFNLQGVHPAGTTRGNAKFIKRTALERGCVSPVILRARRQRNFIILACFSVEKKEALTKEEDMIEEITIGSWYHRGGFDHNITFEDASIHLHMRALMFPSVKIYDEEHQKQNESARRIMFESRDTPDMDHALYVQQRFMYAAMERNCNDYNDTVDCRQILNEITFSSRNVTSNITLWSTKSGRYAYETATGLETKFRVPIVDPFGTIDGALGDLVTSAVIQEKNGVAEYERVIDDLHEDGMKGLMTEEIRTAGLALISIVLAIFLCALIIMRYICRPISLASIAATQMNDGSLVSDASSSEPPAAMLGAELNMDANKGPAEGYSQSSEDGDNV